MFKTIGCRLLYVLFLSAVAFSMNVYAQDEEDVVNTNDTGVTVKWSYLGNDGPARWSQLSPAFALCSNGRSQSPINIPKKIHTVSSELLIDYHPAEMVILDDGETSLMIDNAKTVINDGHTIQLNFNTSSIEESISIKGKAYNLVQLHFHTPSENQWHGRTYPMEIHFVHQSNDNEVAVIGVFVVAGAANPAIQKIIDHAPLEHGREIMVQGERINPDSLLPAKKDYYKFPGSLTTPPCTEGLHWLVMANAITASPAQIVALKNAIGGVNARPIQALFSRPIIFASNKS